MNSQMIIATPHATYDQDAAAQLLAAYPKNDTNLAILALTEERVIHKQPTAETGRSFGFTTRSVSSQSTQL